ncbi:cytochrome P450 [Amycolatopsis antarctica]|uniref:Cytochrome P450 n=1 Tax=Amycolatopsis antarctica TaxID=1854586 RepID=A0A263D3P3_9PSEU|nr:cytochrome P450 [Amycolatopsis antarctica]OZM73060.1 cytochrome P450 [Amycolatopsis antarctica]
MVIPDFGRARARVIAWLGRRYFARTQKHGLDLSKISLIPDEALMALKRDGLDPVPELARVRADQPISTLPLPLGVTAWLVTGHDEAKAVLSKVSGFSSDFTNLMRDGKAAVEQNPGGLGFADPPVHTRLRRLLTPEFTMRRIGRLAPRIDAIITEQLDTMEKSTGPVDLWQEFALPIPSLTICELLGVPYEDRAEFQRLSTARFDLFAGASASLGAISESLTYLLGIVEKQRRDPGDGLLGMLIKEHGDEIDDRELAGLADGVLTGGLETTASMLALGALVLLENPDSAEQVLGEQDGVHRFVEELLRYLTVVQVAFPRFATEDMEIAGVSIARGDIVVCSLSGANRDETLGPHMERFDPSRAPAPHLAFGHGIHRCIGAELARMELRAAYPALMRRFPEMRLAIDPAGLSFRGTSIVYGVDALPVVLN